MTNKQSEIDYRILQYIQKGRENAIDRFRLAELTGLGDRELRKNIADLREDGFVICNAQDGSGYYLAVTDDDFLQQYKQVTNRAMSILKQRKFLRRELKYRGYKFDGRAGNVVRE